MPSAERRAPSAERRAPSAEPRTTGCRDLTDASARDAFLRQLARRSCHSSIRDDIVQAVHVDFLAHVNAGKPMCSIQGLCGAMLRKAARVEARWMRRNQQDVQVTVDGPLAPPERTRFWERLDRLPPEAAAAIAAELRGRRSKAVFLQWAQGWSVAEIAEANGCTGRARRLAEEDTVRLLARLTVRVAQIVGRLGIRLDDEVDEEE